MKLRIFARKAILSIERMNERKYIGSIFLFFPYSITKLWSLSQRKVFYNSFSGTISTWSKKMWKIFFIILSGNINISIFIFRTYFYLDNADDTKIMRMEFFEFLYVFTCVLTYSISKSFLSEIHES